MVGTCARSIEDTLVHVKSFLEEAPFWGELCLRAEVLHFSIRHAKAARPDRLARFL